MQNATSVLFAHARGEGRNLDVRLILVILHKNRINAFTFLDKILNEKKNDIYKVSKKPLNYI